jgi:hypothetical protein
MTLRRTARAWRLVASAAVLLLLAGAIAGCTSAKPPSGSTGGPATGSATATSSTVTPSEAVPATGGFGSGAVTAQGYYDIAYKSAKASVPDAVFFVVQVPTVATVTPSPTWGYLFGSKKSNKVYLVTVVGGKADKIQDLGASALKATQWATIPSVDGWKIDSNVALAKAAATYQQRTGKTASNKYAMGMATFVPTSDSGIKAFVWTISFDPEGAGDAKSRRIDIDAKTGAALPQAK